MLLLSCKKVSRVASESLDRKLSGYERTSYEAHLVICPPCRRNKRQMELLEKLLRGSEMEEGKGQMSAEGKEKIRKVLESGGKG
jgi:hypothetical protein